MKRVHLDLPELGFIVGTRAILGAGIAIFFCVFASILIRDHSLWHLWASV